MNRKRIVTVTAIILLAGIGIQFTGPRIQPSETTGTIEGPQEVMTVLQRACFDCHSNETQLRWYDRIAPVSWLVASDVNKARSRFNFSQWDQLSPIDRNARLWEIYNMVDAGLMPQKKYTAVHTSALLTPADMEILRNHVNSLAIHTPGDTARINAADAQFKEWQLVGPTIPLTLPRSLNGIDYIHDYRNWQVISTTSRFDNGTVRVIYGNDIAIQAIKTHKINPWPNGAILIKVQWDQLEDGQGNVHAGKFRNFQYMIRDDNKYRSTEGWGFARFDSPKLTPYGAVTTFSTECINCHQMVRRNGFVFDLPGVYADKADNIPFGFDDKGLKVITTFSNDRMETMSTLYGNTAALHTAIEGIGIHVSGEEYTLVTARQMSNRYWYGSTISGTVEKVEKVTTAAFAGKKDSVVIRYQLIKGSRRVDNEQTWIDNTQTRIDLILHQRPSVFP